jgi:transcriptional regulator with XRE-family HTH domain
MNDNNSEQRLGVRIWKARIDAKLSQKYLAKETGVPVYRISDIESGMNHYHGDSVKRLCDTLGIQISDVTPNL